MASYPKWLRAVDHERWDKPWLVDVEPSKAAAFKKNLWDHGLASPHFTRQECASKDGVAVPDSLRTNCQRHCFKLERLRRELGRPLGFIDLYRSPAHNAAVGGESASEHMYADASDWGSQPDQAKFNTVAARIFDQGGIGRGANSGNVQHVDDGAHNGGPRRWTYANR